MRHVTFPCPLCREAGRVVPLVAEPAGRFMVVVDLRGCVHAEGFGDLRALTDAEEWRVITAALDARGRRPPNAPGDTADMTPPMLGGRHGQPCPTRPCPGAGA